MNPEEEEAMVNASLAFYFRHARHIEGLLASTENIFAPSGSDLYRPELWKAAHWRWFFSLYPREVL